MISFIYFFLGKHKLLRLVLAWICFVLVVLLFQNDITVTTVLLCTAKTCLKMVEVFNSRKEGWKQISCFCNGFVSF